MIEKVKDILENPSKNKITLIEKIMSIYMEWEKEFFKKYPRHNRYSDEEIKNIQDEENKILTFIENNESVYELTNLSYSKYSHWELEKAVDIFPIYEEFDFSCDLQP